MACKTIVVVDPDLTIASFIKKSILAFDPAASVILFSSLNEVQPLLTSSSVDCLILDSSILSEEEDVEHFLTDCSINDPSIVVITGYPAYLVNLPDSFKDKFSLVHKPLDANRLSQVLKSIIGQTNTEMTQQVTLDSEQFNFCQGVVRKLKNQLGARIILLSDTVGRILVSAGETPDTTHDLICSLLGGSIASTTEASKSLEDENIVSLVFREGNINDLYAINVGTQLLLIILINKTGGFSRMGTAWHYSRQCAIQLARYFEVTGTNSDQLSLIKSSVADITTELDKLFNL